nr:MAG TPA: hypothetical protein [Caudoviricetes sp.]DAM26033.1 MAG TPA: hypothetical protein [Caudoviricetes sp.]
MTRCIKVIYKSFLRAKNRKNHIRKSLVKDIDTPCTQPKNSMEKLL